MAHLPRMRRAAVGAIAALVAGVVTLAALPAAPVAASSRRVAPASFLYVVQARTGWATKRPNGHWRLSLRGVSVLEFSDRPVRVAKQIPTAGFVSHWKQLFAGAAPNGAIVVQHSPPGEAPTAVEIFRAFWEKPGQLGLCMCTIGTQPGAVRWLRQLTPASAARHGEITIFIDSSVPIQYARDPASPAGRVRRRP